MAVKKKFSDLYTYTHMNTHRKKNNLGKEINFKDKWEFHLLL